MEQGLPFAGPVGFSADATGHCAGAPAGGDPAADLGRGTRYFCVAFGPGAANGGHRTGPNALSNRPPIDGN